MDLLEAREKLENTLNETTKKEYFALLKEWVLFKSKLTKEQFDERARKFLVTNEQIHCHNNFVLAVLSESSSASKPKIVKTSKFEQADWINYVAPSSPSTILPSNYEYRKAASELFVPDSGFVACRIAITAWENDMDGASTGVTELMVHGCQMFLKSIVTAMITKLKSYKIRDGKFQYGFNLPIPDPFIRNFNHATSEMEESGVEIDEDVFVPKCKLSLERAEQEIAHTSAAATQKACSNTLSVRLLYETLKSNPHLLGVHSIQSVNLLRLSLHLSEDDDIGMEF
ncbi:transcriptional adapter 1-like [Cylas formicarius]|uniref:transcriptional adapter 1-like n=1 Tax=Cylas formicarius TaxID=197179 RepID=UPI002958331E|nr:transcriptional adapter 1-like [Cylas formicarius]